MSGKSKEPVLDSKELVRSPLPFPLGLRLQVALAACGVSLSRAHAAGYKKGPSFGGAFLCFALFYRAADTGTLRSFPKKKKKKALNSRPLPIQG